MYELQAFGGRIAALRKQQDITQVQLAELIGVTQQTINSYETGRRRVPVSLLAAIARRLGISIEELVGEPAKSGKRGPTPKLQQQMERIAQLPRARQQFVMQVIESVLAQRP